MLFEMRPRLSSGVDVGAEEGLAENGDQAALGLLTLGSAALDEGVDGKRGGVGGSAVEVGEVQDVSRAADGTAGTAETSLALIKRSSHGGSGKGEDGSVEHLERLMEVMGW